MSGETATSTLLLQGFNERGDIPTDVPFVVARIVGSVGAVRLPRHNVALGLLRGTVLLRVTAGTTRGPARLVAIVLWAPGTVRGRTDGRARHIASGWFCGTVRWVIQTTRRPAGLW